MKLLVLESSSPRAGERPALALTLDGVDWLLLDAAGTSPVTPGDGDRPLTVVLTDAGSDRAGGLLDLRDGRPIDLYATPAVFEQLTVDLPVLPVLQHFCGVHWRLVAIAGEAREARFRVEGWPTLEFTALSTAGAVGAGTAVGDKIALVVDESSSGRRLFYAPVLDGLPRGLRAWMDDSDCVVVGSDGGQGPSDRAAALLPPWLDALHDTRASRKVLLPSPSLTDHAPRAGRREVEFDVELAYGGMEIEL